MVRGQRGAARPPHVQRRDDWAGRFWSPAIGREHHATRTAAGLFDLTPFTKVEVEGPGARRTGCNRVCASEIDRPVGRIVYTTVLDAGGGVVCDLTVTRLAEDRFLVVTGGGSGPRDVAWLRRRCPRAAACAARHHLGAPRARPLGPAGARRAGAAAARDLDAAFPYLAARQIWSSTCRPWRCASPMPASSAGSSTCRRSTARWLWDRCSRRAGRTAPWRSGSAPSTRCASRRATASPASTCTPSYTADEAGLGFTVHLTKPPFVGREAVLRERERGARQRLVPIVLDDPRRPAARRRAGARRRPPRGLRHERGLRLRASGESIAYAWLPPARGAGQRVAVRIFDRVVGGVVASEPRWDPAGERLRA